MPLYLAKNILGGAGRVVRVALPRHEQPEDDLGIVLSMIQTIEHGDFTAPAVPISREFGL